MPIIEIKMMSGRTLEQKRNLVKSVTEAVCASIDTISAKVKITLTDIEPDSYAIGGQLVLDQDDYSSKAK